MNKQLPRRLQHNPPFTNSKSDFGESRRVQSAIINSIQRLQQSIRLGGTYECTPNTDKSKDRGQI
mgnify:CR=1 FL=1